MKARKASGKTKKKQKLSRYRELFEKVKPRLSYIIPAVLGISLILASLILNNKPLTSSKAQINSYHVATPSASKPEILVDIEGEVANPGIYKVKEEARIAEVVQKAGGFTQNANLDWIEKYLNMAQKISDGTKIYIPNSGENVPLQTLISNPSVSSQNQIININTASLQELDTLEGVGEVTAKKIIDGRPYQKIEDLKDRKIVKPSVFEKIKDRIRVY